MAACRVRGSATFYDELGVSPDVDPEQIERAYKKKALATHPDKHPGEEKAEWTAKFQHLQEIHETLSSEQSRRVYDEKHLVHERTARVLLLMDMNGSLLCKVSKREHPRGLRAGHDFEDRDNYFFVRPHAKEFLMAMLASDSNVAFAIYTSRQPRNAQPQVDGLFRACGLSRLHSSLFKLFAGDEFSVPDREEGPHKSKRSLPKIWRDRYTCAQVGVKFDECNTVNLDNDARKLKDHPKNGLVVPSYTETHVGGGADSTLPNLKDYLLRLASEAHGDVREYMRLFPFSTTEPLKPRALPPVSEFEVEDGPPDGVEELTAGIAGFSLK